MSRLVGIVLILSSCLWSCADEEPARGSCVSDQDCASSASCVQGACVASGGCRCLEAGPPVCGDNGQTYPSACEAACAGVQTVREGSCTKSCWTDAQCSAGQLCAVPLECSMQPDCFGDDCVPCAGRYVDAGCACSTLEEWVCGVDGLTYLNECMARCVGVATATYGSCAPCPPAPCELDCPGGLLSDANGCGLCECAPQSCYSELDCAQGWSCAAPVCEGCESVCVVANRLCNCEPTLAWVCGVDGQSYPNACAADCLGVQVAMPGPCTPQCPELACELDCGWGYATDEQGCPQCACHVGPREGCTDSRDCLLGEWCNPAACAPSCFQCADCRPACEPLSCDCAFLWEPVCDASTWTYANACEASCAGSLGARLGSCTKSCSCSSQREPVCGIDGHSYANECQAECEGVEIAYLGYCLL